MNTDNILPYALGLLLVAIVVVVIVVVWGPWSADILRSLGVTL